MIQTGITFLDSQAPGWNLNIPPATGQTKSFHSQDIPYHQPFSARPTNVVLAVSGIESTGRDLKFQILPSDVEAHEFNIRIDMWGETILHKVVVTWIAHD